MNINFKHIFSIFIFLLSIWPLVSDLKAQIDFSSINNQANLEFQFKSAADNLYGVTIINHGWQLSGLSDPFDWMIPMAEAIRNRTGAARILRYQKNSGSFEELPGYDTSGETILLFDWITESDNSAEGFSESAADALFAALLQGEQNGKFTVTSLHFIGHSRGCTVNSETAERLLAIGKEVDHITNLDPHDWGGGLFNSMSVDYDVNPDSLVIDYPENRSPNRGIVSWEGVGWIDTYWQENGFGGRAVYGSYNLQLQNIGHSEVHDWYQGTIDGTSGEDSWFTDPYPDRNESGFNYSRLGTLLKPEEYGTKQPIIFTIWEDGIVNGDFSRGPDENQEQYPGWSEHGGGGDGEFINGKLALNQSGTWREHNRFYIPHNADKLKFLLNISQSEAGTPPAVDKARLIITSDDPDPLFEEYTDTIIEKWIEIDITAYRDSIVTIRFELVEGGGNGINSHIEIDSITIEKIPAIMVDISVVLEGSYQTSSMSSILGDYQLIELNQPYNVMPWNYSGNEIVQAIPDNVVDWVLVELRNKNNNSEIISSRAAFVLTSGKIVDLDGVNPVSFSTPPDDYYISVKHRNHLPIMSRDPVSISIP